jgi:aryl-alcohol dehydrogenase-like predicted oxidoreductase
MGCALFVLIVMSSIVQVPLPANAYHALTPDLTICRILSGLWQVAGGHGPIVPSRALAAMQKYHYAGFTSWDLADNYGPAEDFIGAFRRKLAMGDRRPTKLANQNQLPIQALTKWIPAPGRKISHIVIAERIKLSLRRMETDCLDLLQFHWWDYGDAQYLDALKYLADLQAQGKIRHLALTNFDTVHLQKVLDAGIPIVTNQVQFSLVDQRPLTDMVSLCQARGIHLFAYGTICGGFLSANYLGQPEPGRLALNTASLRKYKAIIDAWGGWELFQSLLVTLAAIAAKHQVSIANVAVRYVLDQPMVAGAIVGARLGISEHISENRQVFDLVLDADDREAIFTVCDRSHDLFQYLGDCGAEYRN